jgi:serine phosphatase RsbU (regulator of sigma subunit)
MSPDKELYGEERMRTLLAGLQERSPAEIVQQFIRAVTDWTRTEVFEDDLTLVVVKGT